jgi:hypothetical protein
MCLTGGTGQPYLNENSWSQIPAICYIFHLKHKPKVYSNRITHHDFTGINEEKKLRRL